MNLSIYYYESPVGIFKLEADNSSLQSILFMNTNKKLASGNTNWVIERTIEELDAYFRGDLKKFSIPITIRGSEFESAIYRELAKVPYGETCSYKDLAVRVGRERAYRAVGTAVGKNRFALIVPCHRVISSNSKLGGYGTVGLEIKLWLLNLEGVSR